MAKNRIIASVGERGKINEMTPEGKAVEALKEALSLSGGFGIKGTLCYATDIKLDSVSTYQQGALLNKLFANNSYYAKGTAVIHTRDIATDTIGPKFKHSFRLKFNDKLDPQGLPDLDVTSCEYQRI